MKSRHAAALALVAWYLTIQPQPEQCLSCENTSPVDVWGVYPKASDCEAEQRNLVTVFVENERHPERYAKSEWQVHLRTGCSPSNEQMFKAKESQHKFLSPSDKKEMLRIGIP